jgi:hypothetical protein
VSTEPEHSGAQVRGEWSFRGGVNVNVLSLGLSNATEEQQVHSAIWDMPMLQGVCTSTACMLWHQRHGVGWGGVGQHVPSGAGPIPPACLYAAHVTSWARRLASASVAASAYTRTTSSVPEGRTKARPCTQAKPVGWRQGGSMEGLGRRTMLTQCIIKAPQVTWGGGGKKNGAVNPP